MFKGTQINEIVELIEKREVKLYHSAQYNDFKSYLTIGGIPSRALLQKNKLSMTEFVTDQNDKINNVWDKVFLNLEDFGKIFAGGYLGVPTVYGPIAFVFSPIALREAEDIAICLRSAGCKGFDRQKESLKEVDEVNKLFRFEYDQNSHLQHQYRQIKNKNELKQTFNLLHTSSPEISLTIEDQILVFDVNLVEVIVDPYKIKNTLLVDLVNTELSNVNIPIQAKQRWWGDRWYMMPEIVDILSNGTPSLDDLGKIENLSDRFKNWIKGLKENDLGYQWQNYATYLKEGTIIPIIQESNVIPF